MSARRDAFLRAAGGRPSVFAATGYYHFLGRGDVGPRQPLSLWAAADWERWLDGLAAAGHTRVWWLVNGYTLAWPSRRFPGLVDPDAVAARDAALIPRLVAMAHARGLKAYAVFTADGHAVGWRSARPDLACVDRAGAPVGDDTVCLELPEVADGLDRMQEEVHALGAAWDGVVFHPTEATPLRFNPATAAAFRADTGGELAAQPDEALLPWFNERWARALARWMAAWQRRRPGLDAIAFNCWWTNADPAVYARLLPATARVCVWDYDRDLARWRDRTLVRWAGALDPARLVVMPSSGGYPDHGRPPTDEALRGVDRLLSLALHLKVRETVLFAGWGAGPAEEQALDRALLAAASGALAPPTDGLLDALDADYEATRASLKI